MGRVVFVKMADCDTLSGRASVKILLVVVGDTGPGIPEQALSKIFKRFYSERSRRAFWQ